MMGTFRLFSTIKKIYFKIIRINNRNDIILNHLKPATASRSRSFSYRDSNNGSESSYFMDLGHRRKLLNDISQITNDENNISHFTLAFNSASVISALRRSQYKILNQQSQFDESNYNYVFFCLYKRYNDYRNI